jgi:HSP20 family protein
MLFYDPFGFNARGEMSRLQRQMNQLFREASQPVTSRFPAVNIWTNKDAAVVTAELPGYDPKELDLSVVEKTLTISGKRNPSEKESMTAHRRERTINEFERTITLPFTVEADKINAKFENGILKVEMPRSEADKPKRIQVK